MDLSLKSTEKNLRLYVDMMYIDGKMALISVLDPLNLILVSQLDNESRMELGLGLQGHLTTIRSRDYVPYVVYTDSHSTFRTMTQDFPGVKIDLGGASDMWLR